MSHFTFRRPALAVDFCESLSGSGLHDARSGLFLSGRRRVGKSTFLREDLTPEIRKRNWLPVYVDLWKNKTADPAILLGDAIKSAFMEFDGMVMKAARALHMSKVSVGGSLTFDLSTPGLPDGVSMADAFAALHKKAQRPIVLIVDEAQHALTTEQGSAAMFGLKAARDQLNQSGGAPLLMLVMTGSNRDKLAHLVLHKSQPFYGSRVTSFPLLGRPFTDAFTEFVNHHLGADDQLLSNDVFAAFELVGQRPEILRNIIGDVITQGEASHFANLLQQKADQWHNLIWGEFDGAYQSLTALQKAVINVMVGQGPRYSPFSESSMTTYRNAINDPNLSTSAVQSALDALRERGLVWRESRGAYALEDDDFAEWHKHTLAAPPQ